MLQNKCTYKAVLFILYFILFPFTNYGANVCGGPSKVTFTATADNCTFLGEEVFELLKKSDELQGKTLVNKTSSSAKFEFGTKSNFYYYEAV